MASQVLSGSSNVSYTNNTGQNVRIVINFMGAPLTGNSSSPVGTLSMSWAGVYISTLFTSNLNAIGRNLGFISSSLANSTSASNAFSSSSGGAQGGAPTEIMLAPGQTFSAVCGPYNIVIIPEAG